MFRDGDEIALTATEFELLRFLMRNPRRVLSKAQILDRVWNYDFGGQANVVELYISYLRKKIDAGREPMIHTMRGAGYVLKPVVMRCGFRVASRSRLVAHGGGAGRAGVAADRRRRPPWRCAPTSATSSTTTCSPRRTGARDSGPARGPGGRTVVDLRNQAPGHAARDRRLRPRTTRARDRGRRSAARPTQAARRRRSTVLADLPTDGDAPHRATCPDVGRYRCPPARLGDGATVVAGLPTEDVDDAVASLVAAGAAVRRCSAVVAAGGVGTLVVRRQLRPLREVADDRARGSPSSRWPTGEIELSERVPDAPHRRAHRGRPGGLRAEHAARARRDAPSAARHRSEQQVRQFVADASHELRTPLATIAGYAELARRRPDDAVAAQTALAKVERSPAG